MTEKNLDFQLKWKKTKHDICLPSSATVSEFKNAVMERTQVLPKTQKLLGMGKKLDDQMKLCELGLKINRKSNKVHVTLIGNPPETIRAMQATENLQALGLKKKKDLKIRQSPLKELRQVTVEVNGIANEVNLLDLLIKQLKSSSSLSSTATQISKMDSSLSSLSSSITSLSSQVSRIQSGQKMVTDEKKLSQSISSLKRCDETLTQKLLQLDQINVTSINSEENVESSKVNLRSERRTIINQIQKIQTKIDGINSSVTLSPTPTMNQTTTTTTLLKNMDSSPS